MICGEDESVDYLIQSDCDGRWICIWNQLFVLFLASNLPLFMGHTVLILRESLSCTTMVWLISGTGPDNIVGSVELVLESSACFQDRRICFIWCKLLCPWTVSDGHSKMYSCANENFRLKSLPMQMSRLPQRPASSGRCLSQLQGSQLWKSEYEERHTELLLWSVRISDDHKQISKFRADSILCNKKVFLLTRCFLEKSGGEML